MGSVLIRVEVAIIVVERFVQKSKVPYLTYDRHSFLKCPVVSE